MDKNDICVGSSITPLQSAVKQMCSGTQKTPTLKLEYIKVLPNICGMYNVIMNYMVRICTAAHVERL